VDATSETNDDDNDNDALFPSKNLARHRDSRNGGVRSSHVIPSSRFVTRMIPLQITCYAAIEEIAAAFRSLLEWHLQASRRARDSDRRDANRDRSIPSSSLAAPVVGTKESTDAPGAATSSTGTIASPAAEHVEPLTAEATSRATTTYMIQSKRRHCDNVRSHDVIERVTGLVPDDWKVDLKSPDVVVWVEICSTLAGLSIVPSVELREAYHFNLLRARTATAEDEPSLSRARAAED
jgi:tRNA(Ser,Leu) C12 N-acetylase TAN1